MFFHLLPFAGGSTPKIYHLFRLLSLVPVALLQVPSGRAPDRSCIHQSCGLLGGEDELSPPQLQSHINQNPNGVGIGCPIHRLAF